MCQRPITHYIFFAWALSLFAITDPAAARQDFTWTGASFNDSWANCNNWDIFGVPGTATYDCNNDGIPEDFTGSNVIIPAGGDTVLTGLFGVFILNSLTVQGGANPRLALQFPLTLNGASSFQDVGIFSQLELNASVAMLGASSWNGATTISGPGPVLVNSDTFTIGSANTSRTLDGTRLANFANVTHFRTLNLDNGALIENRGTWTLGNGLNFASVTKINTGGTFTNFNTITTNLGGLKATFTVPLNMRGGSIDVQNGIVSLEGGGTHSSGAYTIAAGGTLRFGSNPDPTHIAGDMIASGNGIFQIFGDLVIDPGGTLSLIMPVSTVAPGGLLGSNSSSAIVTCDGALINEGGLWWTGMTLEGQTGLVNSNIGTVFIRKLAPQDLHTLRTTFENNGIVKQTRNLLIDGGKVLNSTG